MGAPGRQERREDEKPPERRVEAGEERRGDTQGGSADQAEAWPVLDGRVEFEPMFFFLFNR